MEKIEFLRTKTQVKERIIFDLQSKELKNRRKTILKGYDHILNRWIKASEKTELLPIETYPTCPEKSKTFNIVLVRNAVDTFTAMPFTRYFKQKICVSMKDKENNVYLVLVDGKLFMSDVLYRDGYVVTAPLSMNFIMNPKYQAEIEQKVNVKFEEPTPITEAEKDKLKLEGYPLYEQTFTPEGSEFTTIAPS